MMNGQISIQQQQLNISEWLKIRTFLSIDEKYIIRPPMMRNCVFGTETGFSSPYSEIRRAHKHDATAFEIDETKATSGFKNKNIYSTTGIGVQYSPPTPLELRSILFWTGYSLGELSMLLGMRPKELGFLSSKNAINHSSVNNKTQKILPARTKYISFAQWRRFIEVFNLSEPRKIPLLKGFE